MAIAHKVQLVEALFDRLEKEIVVFQAQSQLNCCSGCGACCSTPEIEASPLEFLPWALHLFLNGEAEKTLETLQHKSSTFCYLYQPLTLVDRAMGRCSNYRYRGLICRLFGYAATRDKYGQLRLATCKIIKEGQNEHYKTTEEAISKGLYIPVFTDYYMQLSQIDARLGTTMMPINKALSTAIEEVLHYYAYRPFPTDLGNIA
jgi:Fe-S-cluster containining protein